MNHRTAIPVLHDVRVGHEFVPSTFVSGPVLVAVGFFVVRRYITSVTEVLIAAFGRKGFSRHHSAAVAGVVALTGVAWSNHAVLLAGVANVDVGGGAGSERHSVEGVAANAGGSEIVVH